MRSRSFQRVSQAGAVLFVAAFTLVAWVGSGSLKAGEEDRAEQAPTVLVQPDDHEATVDGTQPVDGRQPLEEAESSEPAPKEPVPPMEPIDPDALVPLAGSRLTIVGVVSDDVLNFRTEADPQAAIVATKPASEKSEIVATGEVAETQAGGIWWEVTVDGQVGWANARFLSVTGLPQDITVELVKDLPTLRYDSPLEAALAVADTMATTEPTSQVTVVNEPELNDGGVIFVDVLGIGDKSIDGYRLRVELLPVRSGSSEQVGAWVSAVEATPLCRLGVAEGLCI